MATPEPGLNSEIGLNRVQPSLAHTSRFALVGGALLLVTYALCWIIVPSEGILLRQLWFLPSIGVIGAIIANASGTGGGVVFVPLFNVMHDLRVMDLDPLRVTAVSMGICFLMRALRWTDRLYHQREPALETQTCARLLACVRVSSDVLRAYIVSHPASLYLRWARNFVATRFSRLFLGSRC